MKTLFMFFFFFFWGGGGDRPDRGRGEREDGEKEGDRRRGFID